MKDFAIGLAIQIFNYLKNDKELTPHQIFEEIDASLVKIALVGSVNSPMAAEKLNLDPSNFCGKMRRLGIKPTKANWKYFSELDKTHKQILDKRRRYAKKTKAKG